MKEEKSNDEIFVINIFNKYESAKLIIEKYNLKTSKCELKEKSYTYAEQENINNYQKHIQIVDTVLALMPKFEYTIIVKNFLIKANKNWWKKFYSKVEYTKIYKKALNRFLYLYLV